MPETPKQIITRLQIPKTTIAALADVSCQELSTFFRDASQIPAVKRDRILATVAEIRQFLETDWPNAQAGLPVPFPLDLRNAPALRKWMDYVREIETQNAVDPDAVREIEKMYEGLGAE